MLHVGAHVPVRHVAEQTNSLGGVLRRRSQQSEGRPAMYQKRRSGWETISWGQFYERAAEVAQGLRELGLEQGDRVAILGPTQSPWAYYDMGAQLAGMVSVGIYPKQTPEQIRYLVEHSDTRVVFVDGAAELDSVLEAVRESDEVVAVVPWQEADYLRARDRDTRLRSPAMFRGERLTETDIVASLKAIDPADTAILIYTSGTTGPPKGAMVSHRNILALLRMQDLFLELYDDDVSFNFLPMAHAAERVLGFYARINGGIPTAYASSISAVLDEIQEVQPTLFGSVPRLFEKAHSKILAEVARKPAPIQRIFRWASEVGRASLDYRLRDRPLPYGLRLKYAIADRLVFRKIHDAFGGRVREFIIGAAPIAVEILEFFWGAGLHIYEVYGMTEATVITHANRPGSLRLGTVGRPLPGMVHKVAEDGEILVRGPLVFEGYFKNEEATSAAIVDGWLHTGDIGTIDTDGFLRITDRKKHLIITAGGKNLAPANIENAIKSQDPLVSHVHVHGDKRPYISALIAPSPLETLEWGVDHGLIDQAEADERVGELMHDPSGRTAALERTMAKIVADSRFEQRIVAAVRAGNEQLAQVERVRRLAIFDRDFSQEQGELTPTMKLKRRVMEDKFGDLFDRIYDEDGFALQA